MEAFYWKFVYGLAIAVGLVIVFGGIFHAVEWIGRVWTFWRVRRTLRRVGEAWSREHRSGPGVPESGTAHCDVRRPESDREDPSRASTCGTGDGRTTDAHR
jgi:hypothetical protein